MKFRGKGEWNGTNSGGSSSCNQVKNYVDINILTCL